MVFEKLAKLFRGYFSRLGYITAMFYVIDLSRGSAELGSQIDCEFQQSSMDEPMGYHADGRVPRCYGRRFLKMSNVVQYNGVRQNRLTFTELLKK